jgi:hypothetical protein
MVAGREVTPGDVSSTERLMRYWAHGPGAVKIGWGSPGDFDKCVVELGKYVGPGVVKGLCANLHKRATGGWPGHAPGVEEAAAKAKEAAHKG